MATKVRKTNEKSLNKEKKLRKEGQRGFSGWVFCSFQRIFLLVDGTGTMYNQIRSCECLGKAWQTRAFEKLGGLNCFYLYPARGAWLVLMLFQLATTSNMPLIKTLFSHTFRYKNISDKRN
jgi:hypothetical protein